MLMTSGRDVSTQKGIAMNDLKNEWDAAAEKIDCDAMRKYRYGMALRYIREMDKNVNVLEVGCGEGTGLRLLHKIGFENLTGVEVSPERLLRAEDKIPNTVILKETTLDSMLPFENRTFDIVISLGVIEHTLSPGKFLAEISRVLKNDGCAVISSDCLTWNVMQALGMYKSDQPIDRALSIKAFNNLFKANGFIPIHFDTFHLPDRKSPLFNAFKDVGKHIIYRYILNSIYNHDYGADSFTDTLKVAIETSKGNIDSSRSYRIKKHLLNYIDDENIFFIKRITHLNGY